MYKTIKRFWRRFYKAHREGCEFAKEFIGGLSTFALIFSFYILAVLIGG